MKKFTLKIALCGILSTAALIAFILENLFPPIILPGARMGLSNIFILLAALTLGIGYGFAVLIIKTVLGSIFAGNISAVIYSLPAGVISLTAELIVILCLKKISVTAASIFGSVINITLQNAVFCIVTGSMEYMVYSPYLALIGVIGGLIVGLTTLLCIKRLPEKFFLINNNINQ